ncbi:uncharacterized protein LOC119279079 [Triticum dicoccoides]|uniref:uncharacterized protein LOC119279079 n=1 Tax=Triticum dicoccoides TaxID=85692 RepID=UPI00188DD0DB|nr:uncharacterized protein LOC119279079 [Triticum dicoccoides]
MHVILLFDFPLYVHPTSLEPPPSAPAPSPAPSPLHAARGGKGPRGDFASGLAGCLFGDRCAAARSSSSTAAVFERRFASAVTKNSYDEILTSLAKPGGGADFGKYYSLPALADPWIDRLPYSIRILLESAIRNCDEFQGRGRTLRRSYTGRTVPPSKSKSHSSEPVSSSRISLVSQQLLILLV